MCVNRQELRKGTHLVLDKEYEIVEKVGCGASCMVYLAENSANSRKVLIKELYPIDLGIFRNESNALIIPAGSKEAFEQYKEKLNKSVALQISFHNAEDSGNSTSDAEGIIEANNTLYVVMGRVIGESYDKHTPEDLTSVLKIGRSVAKAIAMYHNKGYLHLDIKAENVFKIKETNELIKLFDFDSVHPKEEIQKGYYYNLSFSEPSAAPEVQNYLSNGLHCIDERADIFSIGALIFKKIMGRGVMRGDLRPYKKWNFDSVDLLKTVSPQAKNVLTIIFRDTLAEDSDKRYHDTEELIIALDKAIELSETKIFLADHNITTTTSKDYYISRADKVKEIRDKLNGYHIAYLYGIGGIGKSETAKEYAEINRNQYNIIHLTHYSIDLKHTVAMLNFINLDDREIKFEEKYQIRLNFLSNKEMYSANTLLIIDNYNVAPDSDEYKKNVEVLKELKKLNIHILFTTRTTPNDGNHRIDIEELSDDDLRALFFAVNSKDETNEDRIAQVNELIEAAYRHTLTVDLVAHQTVQIERFGKKTLADYIAVLKNSGLNNEVKLSVYNNKDDNEKSAIIFDHIKALFDFSELTDKERYVMVNACLLPVSGMEAAQFCEFIDLEHYDNSQSSEWGEDSTITNLVNSGWMKRVGAQEKRISLHPSVLEVAKNELKPETHMNKCNNFCYSYLDKIKQVLDDFISAQSFLELAQCVSFRLHEETKTSANICLFSGDFLCNFALFDMALNCYNRALTIIRKIGKNRDCVELYIRIAEVYRTIEKISLAIENYEKALRICKKYNLLNTIQTARIYCGLVDNDSNIIKDTQKLYYIKEATKILEEILPNSLELAQTYCIYDKFIGKYSFNLEFYDKAKKILNQNIFPNDLKTANILLYLGNYNKKIQCYDEAVTIFLRALSIRKKILSENHIKIAENMYEIGHTYLLMKNSNAPYYLVKSLDIYKKYSNHNVEQIIKDIISAYKLEKNWNKVIEWYNYLKKIYDSDDNNKLHYANLLFDMGYAFKLAGDYINSIKYYNASLSILDTINSEKDFSQALSKEIDRLKLLLQLE